MPRNGLPGGACFRLGFFSWPCAGARARDATVRRLRGGPAHAPWAPPWAPASAPARGQPAAVRLRPRPPGVPTQPDRERHSAEHRGPHPQRNAGSARGLGYRRRVVEVGQILGSDRRVLPKPGRLSRVVGELDRGQRQRVLPRERLDVAMQRHRIRIAIARSRRHCTKNDRLEVGRISLPELGGPRDRPRRDAVHDRKVVVPTERAPSRGHLVQEDPDREDVAATIDGQPFDLLGRHVRDFALERRSLRDLRGGVQRLGDPEVDHLRGSVGGDEHVVRGDVACTMPSGAPSTPSPTVGVVQPRARYRTRSRARAAAAPGRPRARMPRAPPPAWLRAGTPLR